MVHQIHGLRFPFIDCFLPRYDEDPVGARYMATYERAGWVNAVSTYEVSIVKLTIRKLYCEDRPWLIKRGGGSYDQHAHMHTRKDAEKVRSLIDRGRVSLLQGI